MFAGPPPGSQFAWEAASPSYEVVEDEEGQNGRAVVGHSMVNYQGSLLVWGGYSHGVGDEIHYRPTNQIYVLPAALTTRSSSFKWIIYNISDGEPPPPTSGACALLLKNSMLIFGGYVRQWDHGVQLQGHTSMLFKLDLDLERWSTCEPRENELIPTPRDKTTGWVHQNRCYFFGGYGPHANDTENPLLYLRRGGEYFADENNEFYWNNQLLVYDSSASMNWTVAEGRFHCQGKGWSKGGGVCPHHYTRDVSDMPVFERVMVISGDDTFVQCKRFGAISESCVV